jgi:hypothetical protein
MTPSGTGEGQALKSRNSMLRPQSNTRLQRTRNERASLVGCVGEPLKRNVMPQV